MVHPIELLFRDHSIKSKIEDKLPYLFQIAEMECSRDGKIGMQVGSLRENIIIALLAHVYGEKHVNTEIPITKAEIDVELYGIPISIKTFTGKGFSGVKLSWTVDRDKAYAFAANYCPRCDMIFVRINWASHGEFSFIPLSTQKTIFDKMGSGLYIKLPKEGTNPRGVEISKEALKALLIDTNTIKNIIYWKVRDIKINPYERWIEYWEE